MDSVRPASVTLHCHVILRFTWIFFFNIHQQPRCRFRIYFLLSYIHCESFATTSFIQPQNKQASGEGMGDGMNRE